MSPENSFPPSNIGVRTIDTTNTTWTSMSLLWEATRCLQRQVFLTSSPTAAPPISMQIKKRQATSCVSPHFLPLWSSHEPFSNSWL